MPVDVRSLVFKIHTAEAETSPDLFVPILMLLTIMLDPIKLKINIFI